jgi:ABC-type uncharacterized transport system permease subunit
MMAMPMSYLLATGFFNNGLWQVFTRPILWQTTLGYSTPLILAALGGTISERSGVVNIAMEGMMLVGAFFSAFTADKVANVLHAPLWAAAGAGVLAAIVTGGLMAYLHGVASIRFRADQIVSGMAINIFALGLTSFLLFTLYGATGTPSNLASIPNANIPVLGSINFLALGTILFQQNPIVYVTLALVVAAHLFLFNTTLGLRIRAVGEHPRAADTAGINVQGLRYFAVILSGLLSGLAGAYLALASAHGFNENMTSGRGFIALAAMIVGKWTPFGALGACLIFGFGEALEFNLSGQVIGHFTIPDTLVAMLPYIITIIAVAGFIGRSTPPAADGIPYDPTASQ